MKKTRAKICNFLLLLLLFGPFALAQTIINTENMMIDDQGKLSYAMSFQGDLNFGNIDLIQFSTAQQLSKSVDKHLFRLLLNYDYIKESGTEISSDYTGQIRYNYRINKIHFLHLYKLKTLSHFV